MNGPAGAPSNLNLYLSQTFPSIPFSLLRSVSQKAIFNQLLWDIGVQAAQIHEIYSLDLDSFEHITYQCMEKCVNVDLCMD